MTDDAAGECAICHESRLTNVYTIPECGHSFHTNCIMTWFRVNHTCPLCKDTGVNATMFSPRETRFYYRRAMSWSRKRDAPAHLRADAAKVKDLKEKIKLHRKQYRTLKSSKGEYKVINKEIRKCNTLMHQSEFKLCTLKRVLANYVRNILIIPVRRVYQNTQAIS